MTPFARIFAFIAVDTLIKVNHQHLCAFDDTTTNQRTQSGAGLGK
jgi:hypothetical protein